MAPDDEASAHVVREFNSLFQPLSAAEQENQRQLHEGPAGTLNMISLECLMIMMLEGLA